MSEKKIIFSGAQPSGKMTLGNYLGAIQNWTKLQDEYDCFYSVVDLHAITVPQEAKNLRANTMQLLAQYLACGLRSRKKYYIYTISCKCSCRTYVDIKYNDLYG